MLKEGWYLRAGNARTETSSRGHLNCLCITPQPLAVRSCFVLLPLELVLAVCSGGELLLTPPHPHYSCYLPHLWVRPQHAKPPREMFPTRAGPLPGDTARRNDSQQPTPGKKREQRKTARPSSSSGLGSSSFAVVSLSPHGQWPLVASNRKDFV